MFPWATAFPTNNPQAAFPAQNAPFPTQQNPVSGPPATDKFPIPAPSIPDRPSIPPPESSQPVNDLFISRSVEVTSEAPPLPPKGDNSPAQGGYQAGPPDVTSSSMVTSNGGVASMQLDNHSSQITELQQKLENSEQKVADYVNHMKQSEEKLTLAERERLRLHQVWSLVYLPRVQRRYVFSTVHFDIIMVDNFVTCKVR